MTSAAEKCDFMDFQRAWSSQPSLLLCDRMARKGLAVVAVDGECPVHSGDGCLYSYVQVSGLRRELTGS